MLDDISLNCVTIFFFFFGVFDLRTVDYIFCVPDQCQVNKLCNVNQWHVIHPLKQRAPTMNELKWCLDGLGFAFVELGNSCCRDGSEMDQIASWKLDLQLFLALTCTLLYLLQQSNYITWWKMIKAQLKSNFSVKYFFLKKKNWCRGEREPSIWLRSWVKVWT